MLAISDFGMRISGWGGSRVRLAHSLFFITVKGRRPFPSRKPTRGLNGMEKTMKQATLSEMKNDLSRYLRLAENEEIVITRHGAPAGVLVGFATEDDWFDYKLEHDARFLKRIEKARQSLHGGRGVKLEDIAN